MAVVAGILMLEIAWGVDPGDALLYIAYELSFVLGPGWLAYRAITTRPGGPLRQLAVGWALGYVLEILAFMATAATGTRFLLALYPLLVLLLTGGVSLWRGTGIRGAVGLRPGAGVPHPVAPSRAGLGFCWLGAAVCLLIVTYVALAYFQTTPLPGNRTISYFQDAPFALSLAGDAKHHWPIGDPSVSGEPMPYHYFVHIHMAAVSQVTGIELPLVVFRLFILPLIVLVVVGLVAAGQSLLRSASVGLIGACVVFLVSQFNLDHGAVNSVAAFSGYSFVLMFTSASYLLGVAIFVPLTMLLGERLAAPTIAGSGRDWILIGLLMVGASDAKVAILPLVIASLAVYGGWRWIRDRRLPVAALCGAALASTALLAVYAWQYAGWSSRMEPDLLGSIHFFSSLFAVEPVKDAVMGFLPAFPGEHVVLTTGGVLFGMIGMLAAQLVGLAWFLRYTRFRLDHAQQWLLSILVAGLLGVFFLKSAPADDQQFFLIYGLIPGSLLSAQGLCWAWLRRPALAEQWRVLAILGVVGLLAVTALMAGPAIVDLFSGPSRDSHTYILAYTGFTVVLLLLAAGAHRWLERWRWAAAALGTVAVLGVGLLDTPIGYLQPTVKNESLGLVPNRKLTPDLYRAMTWIRDNTPGSDVIAVNTDESFAFEYAAFTERRVFLGGSAYSNRVYSSREYPSATGSYWGRRALGGSLVLGSAGSASTRLYPARRALNKAAFQRGDVNALTELSDHFEVRYLLVDHVNGYASHLTALGRLGQVVYQSRDATVIRLS